MIKQGSFYYQPKRCTMKRAIPQNSQKNPNWFDVNPYWFDDSIPYPIREVNGSCSSILESASPEKAFHLLMPWFVGFPYTMPLAWSVFTKNRNLMLPNLSVFSCDGELKLWKMPKKKQKKTFKNIRLSNFHSE